MIGLGEVVAGVAAPRLLARQRRLRDRLRDEEHVAQVDREVPGPCAHQFRQPDAGERRGAEDEGRQHALAQVGPATGAGGRGRIAVLGLLSLLSFAGSIVLTHAHQTAAFYLIPTRAWELGLGALLAVELCKRVQHRKGKLVSLAAPVFIDGKKAVTLRGAGVAQRLDRHLAPRQFVGAEDERVAGAAGIGLFELGLH